MFRVEHLFSDGKKHPLDDEGKYYVEGNVDNMLIVSVPVGTPTRVCQNVQEECAKKFKQDVLVITHNVSLMKTTKLPPKEAAKIIGLHQEVPEGEEPRILTP